ncbi:transglycosylase domain-containing protein [Streptomyces sp. Qhu-G9]|uniref:transglycosylase domain-containing protein n=1 Tax=Streptomyces sp. Qhu-G9 TaxID=3452799 RepID=UPI0022ABD847|nr:transglycosylase domain-containing protein [Streptomyces aurantiacus]WAU86064.1 transglycosylase domain-containing protein [Streptomyces aurantiacus]
MSEHRRKPPQPQGGGRAAARRGQTGSSSGRRAAPRGATESPSDSYDSGGGDRPFGSRAEARRATQRSNSGGGRRRAADGTGTGGHGGGGRRGGPGGPTGPGRGRGRGSAPPQNRIIDYPRAGRYGAARWVPSWKLVTGVFIGFFGSMMAVAGVAYALVGIPDVAKTAEAQNNVYYWADGTQMVATGGETNRQIIDYSRIPTEMRYAVISAENKTFENDRGVDPVGIGRALFNMAKGGETQGGSTITQQYVKNAMLEDQSQTISRKFKELFVSIKVGANVEKEDIMAGYLNSAYYGRGAYGIQAAARTYFDKDAEDLDPSQCAFLAAVLKGATYYDPAGAESIDPSATPAANRQRAETRWRWILDEMVKDGHLTQAKRSEYPDFPKLQNPRSNAQLGGQVGYLVDLAKAYIVNNSEKTGITEKDLREGGYEIHTTFQKKKVQQLEDAVKKVRKENINAKARPTKDKHVQFGGASVDPKTGAIRAIYGGEDATKHFTNNADQTGAQVGSTFKPFVLAAAMKWGVLDPDLGPAQAQDERIKVSPKSLYSGKNKLKIQEYDGSVWTDKDGKEWLQRNDGDESYNPPSFQIDLREAMRVSSNSAYVQLGMNVGLEKVRESALDAGIKESSLASANFPSFSIGTSDPSAIRMAGAYATFAASGKQNEPYSVDEITNEEGLVFKHDTRTKQAFTSLVADNVTDVLKTVVDEGTGTAAKLDGRPVAGKTGTTDGNKSAWFVGYTPQLSTAVSMYRLDDDESNKKREFLEMYGTGGQEEIHGASFPAEIWHDYMEDALKGSKVEPFPTPDPIGEVVNDVPIPTATPTPTETEEESVSPTPTPTESETAPSPSASESCGNFGGFGCEDTGGTNTGGTDAGGTEGGVTSSPSQSEEEGDPRGNANGNGGLFGGAPG